MRVAGVVAATLLLAQAAGAEEIEKRAQADPRGEVAIANVAGDVQVTGWDRNEVQVLADLADGGSGWTSRAAAGAPPSKSCCRKAAAIMARPT